MDGYSSTSSTEGCSALARAQGSLHGYGDPKGAASSSTVSYGGAECWGPKNNTYGWSGKTLQTGEATVALQPSLSSLSRLTLVTARPLGTLEGEKGPCQAAGGRPPPNMPPGPRASHAGCPSGPSTTHRHASSASRTGGTHGTLCTLGREKKGIKREHGMLGGCPALSGVSKPALLPASCPACSTRNRQLPALNGVFKYSQLERPH